MQKVCYIIGAYHGEDAVILPSSADFVIAADGGYAAAVKLGIRPNLVVGDFDSLGHPPSHPNVIQLPAEKDDTDMIFALRKGLELGYRRFVLLGGVGGRVEHTYANLQLLDWLTTQGAQGFLVGEKTAATALRDGELVFPQSMSGYLSVFCNSGSAEGVTLEKLKFPLSEHTLTGTFPLGVSNEFIGESARVAVKSGSLILIWEDQGDFYTRLPRLWANRS